MSTLSSTTMEILKPVTRSLLRTYQVRSSRSADLVTGRCPMVVKKRIRMEKLYVKRRGFT